MKNLRKLLLNVVYESNHIKNNTTFKEQLGMIKWIKEMSNEEILEFFKKDDRRDINVKVPKPSGPAKKAIKMGLSTASIVMPGGFVMKSVAQYLKDSFNYKCELSCRKDESIKKELKSLCVNKCKVSSYEYVVKQLSLAARKCSQTNNPRKCKKKLNSVIREYSNKHSQAYARYRLSKRKAQMKGNL